MCGVDNTLTFHVKIINLSHTDSNLFKILALGANNHLKCYLMNWKLIKHWSCKPKIETPLNSMYVSIMTIILLLPIVAIFNLLINQSHFLISLLSLEGITLTLVLFVPLIISLVRAANTSTSVLLLTFGACEASLGLRLIVLISRSYGTDILRSLTINKC